MRLKLFTDDTWRYWLRVEGRTESVAQRNAETIRRRVGAGDLVLTTTHVIDSQVDTNLVHEALERDGVVLMGFRSDLDPDEILEELEGDRFTIMDGDESEKNDESEDCEPQA